jgi:UDP-N-acetylmuramate dehydrogenase
VADVLLSVRVALVKSTDGAPFSIKTLSSKALGLGYRTSRWRRKTIGSSSEIVLSACLELHRRPSDVLQQSMDSHLSARRAAQPLLPSAGSVFKNPPGDHAARLIEQAGLKASRCGDAMVAEEHANFIVNLGSAKARDVVALISHVRNAVAQKFGVELEPEIELVGEWHGSCSQRH